MNVLILSLAYAPYSGVGAARMTSLSKYLIDKGCGVTVICYNSHIFGINEQKREIPEGVKRICVEKLSDKGKNRKMLERVVEKTIREEKFDICISSVGPYETMFFVHKIKKKWNLPYVIDYRDPWLFEKKAVKPTGIIKYKVMIRDILCQPIERTAIKYAAQIVLVTDKCKEDITKRYKINKGEVIYNGYEEMPSFYVNRRGEKYIIGIAGKFYNYNSKAAISFMEVVSKINSEHMLQILHIGKADDVLASKYPEIYCNVGEKSYEDAMKGLLQVDVLLINYAHKYGLGTKVFDYIALNKPIMYIGTVPSELAEFVEQFENAYVCQEQNKMEKAIIDLLLKKPKFLTERDMKLYSREYQNERYWTLINTIVAKSKSEKGDY